MSRHRRNNTASFCFNPKEEPGADDSPAPNNAQFSTRVRKLLKDVSPLKVPTVPPEPKPPKPKRSPVEKKKPVEPWFNVRRIRRLARSKSLPPISPKGCHFANGVRDGTFTYADVAGEGLSRFLQDGLPKYEVFFGDHQAFIIRRNIEVLRHSDSKEVRNVLNIADELEPMDRWSAAERSKVSRYPMAIRTSGVAMVVPIKQHVSARGKPESNSPTGFGKTRNDSPEVLWMREKMAAFSKDSGDSSPIPLPPLDLFDYKGVMESSSEGGYLLKDTLAPADQLDSKDLPQSSDGWTTSSSSQSSDFDSDEEDLAPEERILREMFPHARYRQM